MNTFKQQCIALRKQDYTLQEIMKITGRSKTSVYFHIKDIPLGKQKQREVKRASVARARAAAAARKGKSTRAFTLFDSWDEAKVRLVAHLLFDGEIGKKRCVYNNRSDALVKRVVHAMRSVYAFPPKVHTHQKTDVCRISYYNVALAAYLHTKSNELLKEVGDMPKEYQRAFLQAFFDDEGCMDFREKRKVRQVRGYQKDTYVLALIQKLLNVFAITATLQGENEVVISGRENLRRFQKEINFSKGVYINGLRSNSIWKESIEKRILLDRAIKSFKH